MIDLNISCSKINEYLSSFIVHKTERNVETPQTRENQIGKQVTTTQSEGDCRKSIKKYPKKTTKPQNKSDFQERLSTFDYGCWTASEISPLLCASYGWKLTEKNILECSTCRAVLCSSLPLPNKFEAYEKFSGILKERLRTAHKDWCGWPVNPSPSEFSHPPLQISTHYLEDLMENVLHLSKMDTSLPYLDQDFVFKELELEGRTLALFYSGEKTLNKVQIIAALLVLCGWIFDTSDKLKCEICSRRIGLWNFVPLKNEHRYVELKERYSSRKAMKERNEAKRKEKERKLKLKEEARVAEVKAEEEALAAKMKEEENAQEVKRAMEKIDRFDEEGFEKGFGEEGIPDMNEEEESVLLEEGEDAGKSDGEDEGNDGVPSTEGAVGNGDSEAEEGERDETEGGNEDNEGEESTNGSESDGKGSPATETENNKVSESVEPQKKETSTSPVNREESTPAPSEGEEDRELGEGSEENELWLEAVGGYVEDNSSSSSDASAGSYQLYSPTGTATAAATTTATTDDDDDEEEEEEEEGNRKRKRSHSSDDSLASWGDEETSKPSKQPKLNEEESEEGSEFADQASFQQILKEIEEKNAKEEEPREESSPSEEESSDLEEEEPDEEEDALFEKMNSSVFDPFAQHRHWCGWIIDYSSLIPGEPRRNVPGYRILPPQLKNVLPQIPQTKLISSQKYARNIEGLKAIRSILDSWALPEVEEEEEEEMDCSS